MINILKGYTWFTQMGSSNPIGIVIAENNQGKERAFIGTGNGGDAISDASHIARTGASFPLEIAKKLIKE